MPNGTEGQVWTAGSDGVGAWQDARGGEIETEYYTGITEDADVVTMLFTPSANMTLTASTSSSKTWYIYKSDTEESGDGIYYDTENNVMKRCIKETPVASYSGTLTTSKTNFAAGTSNYDENNELHAFLAERLVGKKFKDLTSTSGGLYFSVRLNSTTYGVLYASVRLSNEKVTTINNVAWYSSSTTRTLNSGTTYTLEYVYPSGYEYVPYSELNTIPTTYQRVSGGFLADILGEVISDESVVLRDFEVMYVVDGRATGWVSVSPGLFSSSGNYYLGSIFGPSTSTNRSYVLLSLGSKPNIGVEQGSGTLVKMIPSTSGKYCLIRY